MERSVIRGRLIPDYAALHPGYGQAPQSAIDAAEWHQRIVHNRGAVGSIGRDRAQQGIEKLGDGARLGVAHNEHHAGRVVAVGPAFQPDSRVHEMLDSVDHERLIRMLGELHHALDPQQVRPVQRTHEVHEHLEGAGRNGLRIS